MTLYTCEFAGMERMWKTRLGEFPHPLLCFFGLLTSGISSVVDEVIASTPTAMNYRNPKYRKIIHDHLPGKLKLEQRPKLTVARII